MHDKQWENNIILKIPQQYVRLTTNNGKQRYSLNNTIVMHWAHQICFVSSTMPRRIYSIDYILIIQIWSIMCHAIGHFISVNMEGAREERLRRRREQYHVRRNRETEQCQFRLTRQREYNRCRYAAMTSC